MLDKLKEEIFDTIRLYEDGWKDRYYRDKLKKQNVESGGGKKTMFEKVGLCTVNVRDRYFSYARPYVSMSLIFSCVILKLILLSVCRRTMLGIFILLPRMPLLGLVLPFPLRTICFGSGEHR